MGLYGLGIPNLGGEADLSVVVAVAVGAVDLHRRPRVEEEAEMIDVVGTAVVDTANSLETGAVVAVRILVFHLGHIDVVVAEILLHRVANLGGNLGLRNGTPDAVAAPDAALRVHILAAKDRTPPHLESSKIDGFDEIPSRGNH